MHPHSGKIALSPHPFSLSLSGDLLLLVGGGGDRAIRVHDGLGAAYHRHQKEKTQQEEEEESEAQVHVHLELRHGVRRLIHVVSDNGEGRPFPFLLLFQRSSITLGQRACSCAFKVLVVTLRMKEKR